MALALLDLADGLARASSLYFGLAKIKQFNYTRWTTSTSLEIQP